MSDTNDIGFRKRRRMFMEDFNFGGFNQNGPGGYGFEQPKPSFDIKNRPKPVFSVQPEGDYKQNVPKNEGVPSLMEAYGVEPKQSWGKQILSGVLQGLTSLAPAFMGGIGYSGRPEGGRYGFMQGWMEGWKGMQTRQQKEAADKADLEQKVLGSKELMSAYYNAAAKAGDSKEKFQEELANELKRDAGDWGTGTLGNMVKIGGMFNDPKTGQPFTAMDMLNRYEGLQKTIANIRAYPATLGNVQEREEGWVDPKTGEDLPVREGKPVTKKGQSASKVVRETTDKTKMGSNEKAKKMNPVFDEKTGTVKGW